MSWCDLDLIFDLAVVTLTYKILSGLYLSKHKLVEFDLGPLLQGQMRRAKSKSAYNSLIIGPRSLGW